jgi:hypothetical protein
VLALHVGAARADSGRLLDDNTFASSQGGPYLVDADLLAALPSALPSGISTGIAAGVMRECGCHLSYGARASWSTETGSSSVWTVTHWDIRLRAAAAVRYTAGRGVISLRLAGGPTFVHEHRVLTQGGRAGNAMESSATDTLPAGELEAVIGLHVHGPWLLMVSAGPSLEVFDGALRGGWIAQIGVGWQP